MGDAFRNHKDRLRRKALGPVARWGTTRVDSATHWNTTCKSNSGESDLRSVGTYAYLFGKQQRTSARTATWSQRPSVVIVIEVGHSRLSLDKEERGLLCSAMRRSNCGGTRLEVVRRWSRVSNVSPLVRMQAQILQTETCEEVAR